MGASLQRYLLVFLNLFAFARSGWSTLLSKEKSLLQHGKDVKEWQLSDRALWTEALQRVDGPKPPITKEHSSAVTVDLGPVKSETETRSLETKIGF